jgi:electron transfer flavoprotein beta subunit
MVNQMKIVVPIRFVPDLVEELEIDETGTALDETWMDLMLNEFDDHAIEQAVILKERVGAEVTVITLDSEGADDVLATAAAKGADHLIRLASDSARRMNSHALARLLAGVINELGPDLILTGVQAHNDLDGQMGPLLAEYLDLPYVGYVASVVLDNGRVNARKEYPGGLLAEMAVELPAVLGIQAAEDPPRYVAFSRVSQAKKSLAIDERTTVEPDLTGGAIVTRMYQPEVGERATMLEGEAEDIAMQILRIISEHGIS